MTVRNLVPVSIYFPMGNIAVYNFLDSSGMLLGVLNGVHMNISYEGYLTSGHNVQSLCDYDYVIL